MIGILVSETIQLKRAFQCDHEWKRLPAPFAHEEQCDKCGIIATEKGKAKLAEIKSKRRFHGL